MITMLRASVLEALRRQPMTVHECAVELEQPVPSVQPRFSELRARAMIEDSGLRRRNALSGKKAIVWQVGSMTPATEVARIKGEFAARDAAWLLVIRGHLRQGPTTTHDLAKAAGVQGARYFHRFRSVLLKSPCIKRVGEAPGPTGHVNIVWALDEGAVQ